MIVPALIFLFSIAGLGLVLFLPQLTDFILLAGPCAAASLILLIRAAFARKTPVPNLHVTRINAPSRRLLRKKLKNPLVVDGSNVMHWKDGTPRLETLREVVAHLSQLGYSPGVVFDANAGHLLMGKYQHHGAMGAHLGLPEDRVMVVEKGTPADPVILAAARDLGAQIITNDRYKDWADQHPEVRKPGHLVRGGYRDGKLWVDLDAVRTAMPQAAGA